MFITNAKIWWFVAGVGVIFLAILSCFLAPSLSRGWKVTVITIGVVCVLAMFIQALLESRQSKRREASDERRDNLLQGMYGKMFPVQKSLELPITQVQAIQVTENDPRIYVDFIDQRKSLAPKTMFSLSNLGKEVAHKVQILPLKLNCGEALFPCVEFIADKEKSVVAPQIEKASPLWRHDISQLMSREWDHAGDIGAFDFARPMSITYESHDGKKRFKTTFDLVYHAIQDIIQHNWKLSEEPKFFEIQNLRFERVA